MISILLLSGYNEGKFYTTLPLLCNSSRSEKDTVLTEAKTTAEQSVFIFMFIVHLVQQLEIYPAWCLNDVSHSLFVPEK